MRSWGVAATVLVVTLASASPANAASTRAEYIAQLDPICQSYVGPRNEAFRAYYRNLDVWMRVTKKGTLKARERQAAKTARSLRRIVEIDRNLTGQIAAVPAPAEDAETVGTWLKHRNNADRLFHAAANAFGAFKFERYRKLIARANKANAAGWRTASVIGFQVCGVTA